MKGTRCHHQNIHLYSSLKEKSVENTQLLLDQVSLCNLCKYQNRAFNPLIVKMLAFLFQVSLQSLDFLSTCLPNTKELNLRFLEILLRMSFCLSIPFFFCFLSFSLGWMHAFLHWRRSSIRHRRSGKGFFHLHDLGSNADIWQQGVIENSFILPLPPFKGAITSGRRYQLTYFCRHWALSRPLLVIKPNI